jgi:hypothetical protein
LEWFHTFGSLADVLMVELQHSCVLKLWPAGEATMTAAVSFVKLHQV